MLLSYSLIVLVVAVLILFSHEFGGGFKKLFSFPGVKLIVPLFIASFIIEYYEAFFLWLLTEINAMVHWCLTQLELKIAAGSILIKIFFLTLIACLPYGALTALNKLRKMPAYSPKLWFGTVLWLMLSILMVTHAIYS